MSRFALRHAAVLFAVTLACLLPTRISGQEIGYIEDFALAKNREHALKQLIPGTRDYYYYHALHHQNLEQFDKVEELLKPWIARHGHTQRVWEIKHRQALLTYDKNNKATLDYLRQRLNLQFNHQRESLGRGVNLPSKFDQNLIAWDRLAAHALRYSNMSRFEDSALERMSQRKLSDEQRHNLLRRLQRPDVPGLPELVIADIHGRYTSSFGQLPIHGKMTIAQLEALLKIEGKWLNYSGFINAYITKLRPEADIDWRNDPEAYGAYLDRLWAFVTRLSPAHNSLKAHVLYHRLLFDRTQGEYNKNRFMTYIQLPRRMGYVNHKWINRTEVKRYAANLSANYSGQTQLPTVGNDEKLVRDYLLHFFVKETSIKPYETYIEPGYLNVALAESKVLNGLGDLEKWYSTFSPSYYQALKDRVDLDFAFTNKTQLSPDDAVSVDLHVKNVKTLIVKVYEVNTTAYYRMNLREIDTDITLDGLVANEEQTFKYDEPPLRRVKRHFAFPKLTGRGVYVIDFIGNGKNSRMLVRKGKYHFLSRMGGAGHVVTVLDEKNQHVKNATLRVGGQTYETDKTGRITVPYSNRPGVVPVVVTADGYSSLANLSHSSESYQLHAGIYVDRESLLSRKQATVVVRPSLTLNGTPVSLDVLEDVKLTITSVDTDGVQTTKEVSEFKVYEDRESVYKLQTPARLRQVSFSLTAKVQNLSQAKKVNLATGQSFQLNQIAQTEKVEDLHLSLVDGSYKVDLFGRTGEAKPKRSVYLAVKHRDFKDQVNVTLQTDAAGRIDMGPLANITHITARGPEGTSHTWPLRHDRVAHASNVYGRAGEPITIPVAFNPKQVKASDLSLLEMRGGTFSADVLKSVKLKNGSLHIDDLPRGLYSLYIKPTKQHVTLRLTEGDTRSGYVMGDYHLLQRRLLDPLHIVSLNANDKAVTVKLANATKFARVHVFATRQRPAYDPFAHISRVRAPEPYLIQRAKAKTVYLAGRQIGDEFRYILDRKYALKYPGNMLKRPGVLLNPWAIRDTNTGKQNADFKAGFFGSGGEGRGTMARPKTAPPPAPQRGDFASLDYLAYTSAVLLNLTPDKNGVIEIDREQLGTHQHIHVVAVDPTSTVYRQVSLPQPETDHLDLRLSDGLDPKKHYTEQKQITVVGKNDQFVLDDITSGKFEAYDNLARVYTLYATLSGNPTLVEFGFVLRWPKMKDDEKRTLYSKYACHELNFFIYKKDPKFFKAVVKPYLANKKDKTFLDNWLLGNDLKHYVEPWAYARLNMVERVLLARHLDGESAHTARHVTDLYNLMPPNVDRFNQLFGTAIKGSALETGDKWGVRTATAATKPTARYRQSGEKSRNHLADLSAAAAEGAPAPTETPTAPGAPRPAVRSELKKMSESLRRVDAKRDAAKFADADDALEMDGAVLRGNARRKGAVAGKLYEAEEQNRKAVRQLYRKLDKTKEWVENNYYHLPIERQVASLVTVNAFWKDLAQHDPTKPFYSTNLAEASRNFTEMMFALSVLDIPFEAGEHKTAFDKTRMTLKPGSYMVVYHRQIKEANTPDEATPILVNQNFFRRDDRYKMVENERMDKFVTDEFLVHTVYGCQVVVTNPTSARQKLDILLQVPVGAMPVLNGQYTRSVHINLQPYHTQTLEYYFYFPAAGNYEHYPVHVAKREEAIAFAKPVTLKVVNELSKIDKNSWQYISQHGSEDDVIDYLNANNVHAIDLGKIAWRMRDKAFFQRAVPLLAKRHAYHHTLWSYGIYHNDVPPIRQYMAHSEGFLRQCGQYLVSPLATIDPVTRHWYQHMEYDPLVNARAHQLSKRRRIVNDRFNQQYHRLMKVLSYKRTLNDDDLLAVTYFMLLQDRVGEALAFFNAVNVEGVPTRIQYDYMAAYIDMYSDDPKVAPSIVAKHTDHPVDRWRNLFQAVAHQLNEIHGKNFKAADLEDRTQAQTGLAASSPTFEVKVESRQVTVDYQNLSEVTLNYYLMDIEMLFSRNPFVQQVSGAFSYVKPNLTKVVKLPKGKPNVTLPLPAELHNRNVLVEVVGGGMRKSAPYYSNAMTVQMVENYGQLRVTNRATGRPIPKVYVKVYARMNNGQVKFYKDGYTDLRGRFDYTSLNTNELDIVSKFSLLVLSDAHGAVVREASPPKR